MATNKLALIRYRTIDKCLTNRLRKWTLEDLISKVSTALFDYEGISNGISKRTIQADLQFMRSDKLGYNAPIVVVDKKYYTYEDKDYSINNSPINQSDVDQLKDIVGILDQMNGFSYLEEMSDLIARLDNSIHKSLMNTESIIQLEGNKKLKGLNFINTIYQAIRNKQVLNINYKSFKAREERSNYYHPYLLKEYRNRWFVIVKANKGKQLITLALDRIIQLQVDENQTFVPYEGVDFEKYYEDTLGVTKDEKSRANKVILFVDKNHAPYVITKPIHGSQQILNQDEDGITIRLDVVLNFELERELLGFGDHIEVISPRKFRDIIKKRLKKTLDKYKN